MPPSNSDAKDTHHVSRLPRPSGGNRLSSSPVIVDLETPYDPPSPRRHSKQQLRKSVAFAAGKPSVINRFSSHRRSVSPSPLSSKRRHDMIKKRQEQARAAYNYRQRLPQGTRSSPLDGRNESVDSVLGSKSASWTRFGTVHNKKALLERFASALPPRSVARAAARRKAASRTRQTANQPKLGKLAQIRGWQKERDAENAKKTVAAEEWLAANRAWDDGHLRNIKWDFQATLAAARKLQEQQFGDERWRLIYRGDGVDKLYQAVHNLKEKYVAGAHGRALPKCMRVFNPWEWKLQQETCFEDDQEGWMLEEAQADVAIKEEDFDASYYLSQIIAQENGPRDDEDDFLRRSIVSKHQKKKQRLDHYSKLGEPPVDATHKHDQYRREVPADAEEWTVLSDGIRQPLEAQEQPEITPSNRWLPLLPNERREPATSATHSKISRQSSSTQSSRSYSSENSDAAVARAIMERARRNKRAKEEAREKEESKQPITLTFTGGGKHGSVKVLPTKELSEVIYQIWLSTQDLRHPQRLDFPRYLASLRLQAHGRWLDGPLGTKTVRDFGLRDGTEVLLVEETGRRRAASKHPARQKTTVGQRPATPPQYRARPIPKTVTKPESRRWTWSKVDRVAEAAKIQRAYDEKVRKQSAASAAKRSRTTSRQTVSGQSSTAGSRSHRNQLLDWTEDEKDSLSLIILIYIGDVESGHEPLLLGEKLWKHLASEFYNQCNHSKTTHSLKQLWFEKLKFDKRRQGEVEERKWRNLDREILIRPRKPGNPPDPDAKPCLLCQLEGEQCDKIQPSCGRCKGNKRVCVYYGARGRFIFPSPQEGENDDVWVDESEPECVEVQERPASPPKCLKCHGKLLPRYKYTAAKEPKKMLCHECEDNQREWLSSPPVTCAKCSSVLPASSDGASKSVPSRLCTKCKKPGSLSSLRRDHQLVDEVQDVARCNTCLVALPDFVNTPSNPLERQCAKCKKLWGSPPSPTAPSTLPPHRSARANQEKRYTQRNRLETTRGLSSSRPSPMADWKMRAAEWHPKLARLFEQRRHLDISQARHAKIDKSEQAGSEVDGSQMTVTKVVALKGENETRSPTLASIPLAATPTPLPRDSAISKPPMARRMPSTSTSTSHRPILGAKATTTPLPLPLPPSPPPTNPWTELEQRALRVVVQVHLEKVLAGKLKPMSRDKLWIRLSGELERMFGFWRGAGECEVVWEGKEGLGRRCGVDVGMAVVGWGRG